MQLYQLDSRAVESLRGSEFVDSIQQDGSRWLITQRTKDELARLSSRRFRGISIQPATFDSDRWASAASRLVIGWSAATCGPLPADVREEALLRLYVKPELSLEFMGRGIVSTKAISLKGSVSYMDIAGGRRHYAFRNLATGAQADERLGMVNALYGRLGKWIDDPSARIVLSLGGGGFRLFAAQAAVRGLERLLGNDRSKIHEVWGSSGGALLGYTFAHGHDLSVIESLGYLLYHGQTRGLPGFDLRTVMGIARRAIRSDKIDGLLRPELTAWVETIDALCPPAARGPARIPFYALVCNTQRRHAVALTDPRNVPDSCRDFVIGCDTREATGASMAVPFLISPMRGLTAGFERDRWFDGSIAEENPIMLPFTKWMRERKQDPARTPERLKLILVNLNMRFSEAKTLSIMPPPLAMITRKVTDLIDLMLDSKTAAIIRTLREIDNVEVLTVTLQMGQMNFIARGALPTLIRAGQVMEGWQLKFQSDEQ